MPTVFQRINVSIHRSLKKRMVSPPVLAALSLPAFLNAACGDLNEQPILQGCLETTPLDGFPRFRIDHAFVFNWIERGYKLAFQDALRVQIYLYPVSSGRRGPKIRAEVRLHRRDDKETKTGPIVWNFLFYEDGTALCAAY